MLAVSDRLFSCRRAISSPMFSELSLPTRRSSSILACRSAIGCSKSRKFGFIGIRLVSRPGAGRLFRVKGVHLKGSGLPWSSWRSFPLAVVQEDVVAPELVTPRLNPVVGEGHLPCRAEMQIGAGLTPSATKDSGS